MYLLWQYLTFVVFNHYHIIISSPLGWPAPKPSSLLPSNITPILAGPAFTINPPLQQLFDHFRWHSSAKPPSLFTKTWELHIFLTNPKILLCLISGCPFNNSIAFTINPPLQLHHQLQHQLQLFDGESSCCHPLHCIFQLCCATFPLPCCTRCIFVAV